MPIWMTKPVEEEPTIVLTPWTARQLDEDGELYLCGYVARSGEGRVSSEVKAFDAAQLRVTTATGRTYVLQGPPRSHSEAEYVWRRWAQSHRVGTWVDVSQTLWKAHLAETATDAQEVPAGEQPTS